MERNPEFYIPRDKDDAFKPQAGYPDAWQWWFHDAIFTNGYCMGMEFFPQQSQSKAIMWLNVCDPDGKMTSVGGTFPPSAIVASTETLDVKVGDSHMYGKFPRYNVHFRHGDTEADLVYECMTQAVFEPPDGVYIGREQSPATPIYMGFTMRPRCKVTGKLILAGKEIPVEGQGYADHQWTNFGIDKFPNHNWCWGKIYLPKHTIIWWDTHLSEIFGYQRVKWLWALKEEKLFEYLRHADMYVETSNFAVEPETGATYPRKIVLMLDERKIKGTATYTMKHMIFKIPVTKGPSPRFRCYIRYLSDCHSKFEIEGEKVEADTREIHEVTV